MVAEFRCAVCGEVNETVVDESISQQRYTEDCQVCCRPNLLSVSIDGEEIQIHAEFDE